NVTTTTLADGAVTAIKLNTMSATSGQVLKYNGAAWGPANVAPVAITTQPKAFSWSRRQDTNGDPNGPANVTSIAPLSVTATSTGALTYQWYQKSANRNAPDTKLSDATSATYTPVVDAWGMKSYYCVVKNGNDSVVSTIADVAIGCGAKTNQGRWLRFMCYNLGADTNLDPFTYKSISDSTSKDIKGWLFQWGRIADGHQWRSSDTITGPYNSTANIEVPSGDKMYGKFIKNPNMATFFDWRTPQYDIAWRNYVGDGRMPCPSGWRIPTSDEWGSIYREGSSYGMPVAATANTWAWTTSGFQLKPDGTIVTLFLPAAGYRDEMGRFTDVSATGLYWTSESAPGFAAAPIFNEDRVRLVSSGSRVCGFSVRCISETYD
ncbi:MAG: fibrobacter succinogenes major paralogous domain-containing protein, partial [Dysgonamonadaceae bacterium]|nr:fibrobacter succinogenes major paralogous domain-containing protein [Dysgonamonadaceae bacterium]